MSSPHGDKVGLDRASLRLQPPDPVDFRSPDGWVKWKRRFEQYRIASGLATENDDRQISSTLLYCMGEEADAVLLSTNISMQTERSTRT